MAAILPWLIRGPRVTESAISRWSAAHMHQCRGGSPPSLRKNIHASWYMVRYGWSLSQAHDRGKTSMANSCQDQVGQKLPIRCIPGAGQSSKESLVPCCPPWVSLPGKLKGRHRGPSESPERRPCFYPHPSIILPQTSVA